MGSGELGLDGNLTSMNISQSRDKFILDCYCYSHFTISITFPAAGLLADPWSPDYSAAYKVSRQIYEVWGICLYTVNKGYILPRKQNQVKKTREDGTEAGFI